MTATSTPAGSVSCQCVMSPNEGELSVPLCHGLSPLMSFWINLCWYPSTQPISCSILFTVLYPALPVSSHLTMSPHQHNEHSKTPFISFQHFLFPNCEYLFVGQLVLPMFKNRVIFNPFMAHCQCCYCLQLILTFCVFENWAPGEKCMAY